MSYSKYLHIFSPYFLLFYINIIPCAILNKLKNVPLKVHFLVYLILYYAFLTTEDFNFIAPNPSILHSISCPSAASGTKRIFFTFVPIFIDEDAPFTLRSLTTVTESPSFTTFPFTSFITFSSSLLASGDHSYAHSGQTKRLPSS